MATLTWIDTSNNETSFTIQRALTSAGPWTNLATVPANTTTYADQIGRLDGAYFYQVVATNTVGDTTLANFPVESANSPASNMASVGLIASVPPANPTNLTASLLAGPQVLLSWLDNADTESSFIIERSDNGGAFAMLTTVPTNNSTGKVSYTDTTVTAGITYDYRVAAINAAGISAYSNTATAIVPTPPAAPSGVVAAAMISSNRYARVTLTWMDIATDETAYVIERATDAAFTTNFMSVQVGANSTSYQTGNITRNTPFYFRIRAINGAGQSLWVNAAPFPIKTP